MTLDLTVISLDMTLKKHRQDKKKINETTKIKKSVHSKTFSTQQKHISQNDRKYL